jgi:excinuclease UvrABC nuclease subunit
VQRIREATVEELMAATGMPRGQAEKVKESL